MCFIFFQAFTAFGPTVVKPTWFFARDVYDRSGPFSEDGKVSSACDMSWECMLSEVITSPYIPVCVEGNLIHTLWKSRMRSVSHR